MVRPSTVSRFDLTAVPVASPIDHFGNHNAVISFSRAYWYVAIATTSCFLDVDLCRVLALRLPPYVIKVA